MLSTVLRSFNTIARRRLGASNAGWWLGTPIVLVLVWGAWDPFGIRERLDWVVQDQFLKHRPAPAVHPDLLQISMDDRAAEKLGTTDRRHRLARAIRQLERLGAKTVLVDILFLSEGSRNSFFQEEAACDGIPSDAIIGNSAALERYLEDRLLTDALSTLPRVVVPFHHLESVARPAGLTDADTTERMAEQLAADPGLTSRELASRLSLDVRTAAELFEPAVEAAAARLADQAERAERVLQVHASPVTERLLRVLDRRRVQEMLHQSASFAVSRDVPLPEYDDVQLPPSRFAEHAVLGFADVEFDTDGRLRRLPLATRNGERAVVHEALAALCVHRNVPIGSLGWAQGGIRFGNDHLIRTSPQGQLLIAWPMNSTRRWDEVIPQISIADLLELALYDADIHFIEQNLRINVERLDATLELGLQCSVWLDDIWQKHAQGQHEFARKTERWYDETLVPQVLDHASVRKLLESPPSPAVADPFAVADVDPLEQLAHEASTARRKLPLVRAERKQALDRLREEIEGKLCLIGDTTTGSVDLKATPVDAQVPGISVIASALNTMLTGRYLDTIKLRTLLAWTAVVSLVACYIFLRARAVLSIVAAFVGVSAILFGHFWVLCRWSILVSPVLPMTGVVACYFTLTTRRWWLETRERRRIRNAFQHYLHPTVVDDLSRNPERLRLGGEEAELTILFSDIRGFSTISEQLSAGDLAQLLNEYLTAMTRLVFDNGGTLDKYIGDAIMAFYGAPLPRTGHAVDACRTALQMVRRLAELRSDWQARGFPAIDVGVGINTARVAVGNFGSDIRFDYTVIGDGVNLASRLEGLNKPYGTRIIISQSTWELVRDQIAARELDLVQVKGKTEATRVFEVLGELPLPDAKIHTLELFDQALALYRGTQWSEAERHFQQLLAADPNDPVPRMYVERCRDYLANGTPPDWNGVYVMRSK